MTKKKRLKRLKKCLRKGHKRRALIYGIDKEGKPFSAGEWCKRCNKILRIAEEDGWKEPKGPRLVGPA